MRSLLVFAVLMMGAPAFAQVAELPARSYRGLFGGGPPPDPTRTRHEFSLQLNSTGGYDDNLTPANSSAEAIRPNPSGYTGLAETTLRYWIGDQARAFEVSGRGYANSYRNIGLEPSYGVDLITRARTSLGRRMRLEASGGFRDDPFFQLEVFGPVADALGREAPERGQAGALTERRVRTLDTSFALNRRWTRRLTTDTGYAYNQRTFVQGEGMSGSGHRASAAINREFGRSFELRGVYGYSDAQYAAVAGGVRPLVDHSANVAVRHRRNLSATRRVSLEAGAGALYVDTLDGLSGEPVQYWTPAVHGNFRLDFSRSWNVTADYRRSVSVLQGLTPEYFVAHAGVVRMGGFIGSRSEALLSTAYSNGTTGGGVAEQTGRYDGYTGTAQVRIFMTRTVAGVVSYTYYHYRLSSAASRVLGVAPELNRNAVRVGFTWMLPLFGTYLDGQPLRQDGRS